MQPLEFVCASESDTARLGETLAMALKAGDLVTLSGDLGAGKTVLARATIRAAASDPALEAPSPTFTLVQGYEDLPFSSLTHIDLYRLSDESELDELGLDEAHDTGAVLVEWPERATVVLKEPSLAIALTPREDDSRLIEISGKKEAMARLQRSHDIRTFLNAHGCWDAARQHLTGDASTRAYETVHMPAGETLILMNAPAQPDGPPVRDGKPYSAIAHLAEDVRAFVGVASLLRNNGFRAPQIHAQDLEAGLLLIEHLGGDFIIDGKRTPIPERYEASADALAAMHERSWRQNVEIGDGEVYTVPAYDRGAMMIEVGLLADWYASRRLGRPLDTNERTDFERIWNALVDRLEHAEKTLVMRDYHSPNIIWNGEASGTDRIGLIDFQDAVIGPSAYDVASLAQDARVDVAADLESKLVDRYCNARTDLDETAFRETYAIMAAQRATKVAGNFRATVAARRQAWLSRPFAAHRGLSHPLPRSSGAVGLQDMVRQGLCRKPGMSRQTIDQAMVLAAGLGTRMRPITETIPKPLVEVDGKTLLDHALDALAGAGIGRAAVNVHYLPEQIEDACKGQT